MKDIDNAITEVLECLVLENMERPARTFSNIEDLSDVYYKSNVINSELDQAIRNVIGCLESDIMTIPSFTFRRIMNLITIYRKTRKIKDIIPVGRTPVKLNGETQSFMLVIAGENYRCECGCNVFHKPDDTDLNRYKCNSCDIEMDTI